MSQLADNVPGLHPGREWYLISESRPLRYVLYEGRKSTVSLTHSGAFPNWAVSAFFNGKYWLVHLPDSEDPPFQLAETLYDAAKWT
jgi:hypothetical protein